MEIYQAAERYNEHLAELSRNYSDPLPPIWQVQYMDHMGAYTLTLETFACPAGKRWMQDYEDSAEHIDAVFITKQRGGIRYFKTLDAVASALRQIGQQTLVFDLGRYSNNEDDDMTNEAEVFAVDQNWQEETTIYWFRYDGEVYGVAESGPTTEYLDADGCPLPEDGRLPEVMRHCVVTDAIRRQWS